MKEQDLRDKISDELYNFKSIPINVDQCVQIALDYAREEAIGFNKFLRDFYVRNSVKLSLEKTTEELYEIYLTTKTQKK